MTIHTGAFRTNPQFRANFHLVNAICSFISRKESIIDIGAGRGSYVTVLRAFGYNATGIDGTKRIEDITHGLIKYYDLVTRRPFKNKPHLVADVGLFLEVGEHIPRRYESKMLNTVCKIPRNKLIVTWAFPGQPGRGHVNCRTEVYVAQRFALRGWMVNDGMTHKMRSMFGAASRKQLTKRLMFLERKR